MDRLKLFRFASSSLLIGLALVALPIEAGTDTWTPVGQPPGAGINHGVVDPVTHAVYAATTNGLFESTDSGAHWTKLFSPMNISESGFYVSDVALEPEQHNILYAAAGANGVYVSQDSGATWTPSDTGIGTPGLNPLSQADSVQYVSADPLNEGTAYASTVSNGVFKTTDRGQHWTAIDNGFPSPFIITETSYLFGRVVIDPTNPQTLYLPLGQSGPFISGDGVYKSTDGGASWNLIYGSLDMRRLTLDLHDTTKLYAIDSSNLLYYITDTGANQTGPFTTPPQPTAIAVDPSNDQNMVAGTLDSGLYVSSNGGGSWSPAGSIPNLGVQDLVMDPSTPATLYAGTKGFGIYASSDGGATLTGGSGLFGPVGSMLIMGSDRILYMGTQNSGVLKSADQGATWAFVNPGITGDGYSITVTTLVQDPGTPATLYLGTLNGAYKSSDGGGSWSALPFAPSIFSVNVFAIDPENTQTLYAGYGGVYKSVDAGAHWNLASSGLPGSVVVNTLAVDPANSNLLYVGTEQNGAYRSTDAGADWTPLNIGSGTVGVRAIGVDPFNHENVFITTDGGAPIKSSDGGNIWTSLGGTTLTGASFNTIAFDPKHSGTVYLGSSITATAFVSQDGGSTWSSIGKLTVGTNLTSQGVGVLALDSQNPATLYGDAGVNGDGQFYVYGVQVPAASAGTLTTTADTAVAGQLAYSLPGYTGTVSYAFASQPAHGTVTLTDAMKGTVTYTPAAGFTGQDSFTFTVTAGPATSAAATVSVTVNAGSTGGSSGGKSGGGTFGLFTLLMLLGAGIVKKVSR